MNIQSNGQDKTPSAHHPDQKPPIPASTSSFTPKWLTTVLRNSSDISSEYVKSIKIENIGEDRGFASSIVRLLVQYEPPNCAAPQSFIAKLPSTDPETRAWIQLFNRFEREILFYQQLADDCKLDTAKCYFSAMQSAPKEETRGRDRNLAARLPQWLKALLIPAALWISRLKPRPFVILLEDLSTARTASQLSGCNVDSATIVARDLAHMHARFWDRRDLRELGWLPHRLQQADSLQGGFDKNFSRFFKYLAIEPPAHVVQLMNVTYKQIEPICAHLAKLPQTLLHGDLRLDNLFFRSGRAVAIDWDLVSQGPGIIDWVYFAMGNLQDNVSATDELDLLRIYYTSLVENGVRGYTFEDCKRDYTLAKLYTAFSIFAASRDTENSNCDLKALMQCWGRRIFRRLPPLEQVDLPY